MRTVQALVRADHLRTLSLFELRMLPSQARESRIVPAVSEIERLAGAAFVATTDPISAHTEPGSTARWAEWVESAADDLSRNRPVPPSPVPAASPPAPAAMESGARLAQYAIEQLSRRFSMLLRQCIERSTFGSRPLSPASSALIRRLRKRRRAPGNPGPSRNRPSVAPLPWAIPVWRFRIGSTIWPRWSIWREEESEYAGGLGSGA